jgi:peptidyl-prolyl cis-trans isomerase A (cyclophilin A)
MAIRSAIASIAVFAFLASALFVTQASAENEEAKPNVVIMETSMGKIKLELYPDKAPITVKNFLWYVNHKFYENLIFHRVIPNFMVQGGGFTAEMQKKEPNAPIKNEAANGLKNDRGTLAMARTTVVNSATSQFFINLKNNDFLNYKGDNPKTYGYAVFGKVIDGMDVVDKIAGVKTASKNGHDNVPVKPVTILKAYELGNEK